MAVVGAFTLLAMVAVVIAGLGAEAGSRAHAGQTQDPPEATHDRMNWVILSDAPVRSSLWFLASLPVLTGLAILWTPAFFVACGAGICVLVALPFLQDRPIQRLVAEADGVRLETERRRLWSLAWTDVDEILHDDTRIVFRHNGGVRWVEVSHAAPHDCEAAAAWMRDAQANARRHRPDRPPEELAALVGQGERR